jgi:peptidoglycan/xylan/chitin deacetylase (PgdA/CDA1 family)
VDRNPTNLLRVLTYHRIADPQLERGIYPRICVTPQAFERQMRHLARHYHVIAMPELLEIYRAGKSLPPRAALITFDDAYSDFAHIAWPILQRYHLPATLFVPTAFPDHPERVFWWDWLYQAVTKTRYAGELDTPAGRIGFRTQTQRQQAFSSLRDHCKTLPHEQAMRWVEQICGQLGVPRLQNSVLSWEELRQLVEAGVVVGAHTQNHPLMNRIAANEMRVEAVGSLHDLEREIGVALPIFAYPSGGYSDEVVNVLQQAGFLLAFTTGRGLNRLHQTHPLRLHRINVGPRTSLPILQAQLLSWSIFGRGV